MHDYVPHTKAFGNYTKWIQCSLLGSMGLIIVWGGNSNIKPMSNLFQGARLHFCWIIKLWSAPLLVCFQLYWLAKYLATSSAVIGNHDSTQPATSIPVTQKLNGYGKKLNLYSKIFSPKCRLQNSGVIHSGLSFGHYEIRMNCTCKGWGCWIWHYKSDISGGKWAMN